MSPTLSKVANQKMTAPTVSIPAGPPAANTRRRAALAGETKKSTVEFVNDAVIPGEHNPTRSSGGDSDEVAPNSSKDLSHSIRKEKGLERSRDVAQPKKLLDPNSTVSPPRTRKLAPSMAPKPLWRTVLSVLTKNLLLLLVLAGLVQMVRYWVIAEVQSTIKKTTTMLQVQVEKSNADLADRLKTLDEKHEIVKKALDQLSSKDLLSKEGFGRFYEELRKSEIGNSGQSDLSLDEIRALAREIVVKEIEKHAADGLGRADYALASGGAFVVHHSEPFIVGKYRTMYNHYSALSEAERVLKPSFGGPGQCFPLKGISGFIEIRLRTAIIPEAITLEHVAKSVAFDRSSAPRDCRVYGWMHGAADNDKMLLTEFTYDLEKSNAQTYNVFDSATSAVVDTIRFNFTSNHGSANTCIYRLRVHGHELNSLSPSGAVLHEHIILP